MALDKTALANSIFVRGGGVLVWQALHRRVLLWHSTNCLLKEEFLEVFASSRLLGNTLPSKASRDRDEVSQAFKLHYELYLGKASKNLQSLPGTPVSGLAHHPNIRPLFSTSTCECWGKPIDRYI
jgi:hypothetical protein